VLSTPRTISTCLLSALAFAFAGCGGDDEPTTSGEPATEAPSAADFPEPESGSLDQLISDVGETNDIVASPAGAVFVPGQRRLSFGLFDVAGPQIDDADVAVYVQDAKGGGKISGPFTARTESLDVQSAYKADSAGEGDATSVYVAEVPPLKAGEYRAVAVVRDDEGAFAATNFQTAINVVEQPGIPAEGDSAPSVHTPTLEDVGDVSEIDTRTPPSTMHTEDLADVLGKKPVVLLFATPALCQSRVCGPVVDVAEQVKAEFGDDVAFIHMEIYEGNQYDPNNPKLRPQVEAYSLPTEPWLFVIDKDGKVQTRIEGAFSVSELENEIGKLLG
jgi:hypothetical protein